MSPSGNHLAPTDSILVVGASLAGLRTAVALRRRGHAGPLRLIGDEPEWPPYDRPPLSKQVLTGAVELERTRLRVPDGLDLAITTGRRAIRLDLAARRVELDDDSSVPFDRLVVATGATPVVPPSWQLGPRVRTLRSAGDALALQTALADADRVAVIGAGFIGCEVASSCRSLGLEVELIDVAEHPLLPLGARMGAVVEGWHRDAGVALHFGTGVDSIVARPDGVGLTLGDGDSLEVDIAVVGIGVRPTTDWLEGSGIRIDDGVVCDESCLALGGEGAVAGVGDVARWDHPRYGSIRIEHWTNAGEQASHVAGVLVDGPAPFSPVPYFWSDQHGHKLQYVGRADAHDEIELFEPETGGDGFVAAYHRDGVVTAALCVDAPREIPSWTAAVGDGRPLTPAHRASRSSSRR